MKVIRFFTKLTILIALLSFSLWACQSDVKGFTDVQKKDLRDTIDSLRILGSKAIRQDYSLARKYFMDGLYRGVPVFGAHDTLILRLYYNIGTAYYNEGQYNMAYIYFDSLANAQPNPSIEWIKALNDFKLGQCHLMRNETDLSKIYFLQSLDIAPQHKNSRLFLSDILNNYATTNFQERLFDKALYYLQQAIDSNLLKRRDDTIQLADSYNIMCNTFQSKGDFEEAISAIQKALVLYKKADMPEYLIRTQLNLAAVYRRSFKLHFADETLS